MDRKPSQFLHGLQQLTRDSVKNDGAFICKLFLQRLLASTSNATPISDEAKLTDRIMKVAIHNVSTVTFPNISAVATTPTTFNMEQLRAKISSLRDEIKTLRQTAHERSPRCPSPRPVAERSSAMC